MKLLDKINDLYKPRHEDREYIVSKVETFYDNPELMTLSIEVTARPEIIGVLRKGLVGQAYRTLAESTEWEVL